jgi:DNA-binding CsgD family transcriptional regulator
MCLALASLEPFPTCADDRNFGFARGCSDLLRAVRPLPGLGVLAPWMSISRLLFSPSRINWLRVLVRTLKPEFSEKSVEQLTQNAGRFLLVRRFKMKELTCPPNSSHEKVINELTLNRLPAVASAAGVLLVDSRSGLLASNREAIEILTYPDEPEAILHLESFLAGRIRSVLARRPQSVFVNEFESGNRRYLCQAFWLDSHAPRKSDQTVALVLQRRSGGQIGLSQVSQQFHFTPREREAVALLLEGFTNKEIGRRMNISPDTVKVFFQLVMAKLRVTTRSGIIAKIGAAEAF